MKRHIASFFILSLLAIVLTACSEDIRNGLGLGHEIAFKIMPSQPAATRSAVEDKVPEPQPFVCQGDTFYLQTEITPMDSTMGRQATTRGAEKNASNLQTDGFKVSAYNTSDGTTRGTSYFEYLTATYADSKFTPQGAGTAKYWPAGKLMFYAYYPAATASNGITQGANASTLTYTVPSTPANQPDLMTARATNQQYTSGDGTAALTFNHALCAIKFQTGTDLLSGEITSITFNNIYTSGTYSLDTETWSNTTIGNKSFTGLSVSSIHGTSNTAILTGTQTLMMIPQTFTASSTITLNITDLDGRSRSVTFSLNGTSWAKGTNIIYTVNSSSVTTYLRNPLYYVAKYYLNSSKTFETTGGEKQYLWKQATMMTTKFAAQSSSYDGYQIPAGEHSINGVPYHMPTANEWYSIIPFTTNLFSTSITGGTVQTEGACTFGADSSTKTAKAYKSYWNTYVSSNGMLRYAIRFLGTKYCSVWRYRNIGSSASANRALEITAVLIDPIAETATSQLSTKMTQLTNGTFTWPTSDNYTTGAFVRVFYVAGFAGGKEGISTSVGTGIGTDGFMPSTTTSTIETTSSVGPRYGESYGTSISYALKTNGRPIRLFRDY